MEIQYQKNPVVQLPPLSKQQDTYKIHIPKSVEEKIRYLCRKFPTLEWSGILFYTHTGSFEENNLEIHCQDIYPMDLGSSTFTEFKNDESVAGYIADNIELFDCDMGLIHSHNKMSCFFSGTDTATLRSEGNDTNCFVSLIVNNAGTYCAAITRKVQEKKNIITEYLGSSYNFFGNGPIHLTGGDVGREEEVETTSIEYFMLDVDREIVDNPLDFLDKRFDEIEKKKQDAKAVAKTIPSYKYPSLFDDVDVKEEKDNDFFDWIHKKDTPVEKVEKPEVTEETDPYEELEMFDPDQDLIKDAAVKILTCSLLIDSSKFDLKQWVVKHMQKKYEELFFASPDAFDLWKEFIVEYVLTNYINQDVRIDPDNLDIYEGMVAEEIMAFISEYKEYSPFVQSYCEVLQRYVDNLY